MLFGRNVPAAALKQETQDGKDSACSIKQAGQGLPWPAADIKFLQIDYLASAGAGAGIGATSPAGAADEPQVLQLLHDVST